MAAGTRYPLAYQISTYTTNSIRIRDPGIAWSYHNTDPEWGYMQAKMLAAQLEAALVNFEVKVRTYIHASICINEHTH